MHLRIPRIYQRSLSIDRQGALHRENFMQTLVEIQTMESLMPSRLQREGRKVLLLTNLQSQ